MFKVIVAGSRDFTNYVMLEQALKRILSKKYNEGEEIAIVSGMAKGADTLGETFAKRNGLDLIKVPANWDHRGNSAGPVRNALMAEIADALVAFYPSFKVSYGTKSMIEIAKREGLQLKIVEFDEAQSST